MKFLQKIYKFLHPNRHKSIEPSIIRMFSLNNKSNDTDNNLIKVTEEKSTIAKLPEYRKTFLDERFKFGVHVTSYSTHGFRLNQSIHVIGPVILFPRTVFGWNIAGADYISPDSLSIFDFVEPKIELLFIGTGLTNTSQQIGATILEVSKKYGINVEVLSTELACTQFNYFNNEGKMVAAALIPPPHLPVRDDDTFFTSSLNDKKYGITDMITPKLGVPVPIDWDKKNKKK